MFTVSLQIRDTGTTKGRGVFATRPFAKGELVEICPVLILHKPLAELPVEIQTFVYAWPSQKERPNTHAIALGYGSMYNHDNPSNMRFDSDESGPNMRLTATRDIEIGEEMTINYNAHGGGSVWHNNDWFDHWQIDLIHSDSTVSAD